MKTTSIIDADCVLWCYYLKDKKNQLKTMKQRAIKIFSTWQKGESGNGYQDFINLLDAENFNNFSHPLIGNYTGKEGIDKLQSLVKERNLQPNSLTFSNTHIYCNGNSFCFQFDSEGTVGGGFAYKGFNIIQLELKDNKLVEKIFIALCFIVFSWFFLSFR